MIKCSRRCSVSDLSPGHNRECVDVGGGPVKWSVNGRTPPDRAVASTVWHVNHMLVPVWVVGVWFCVNQARAI